MKIQWVKTRQIPSGGGEAEGPAGEGEDNGFDEELAQDIAFAGADGHADSDVAARLRHGDEHDIHDADAADDQRDAVSEDASPSLPSPNKSSAPNPPADSQRRCQKSRPNPRHADSQIQRMRQLDNM